MDRDPDAVARFVERFGALLEEAGMPRMAARTFAALLADDEGAMTAAALAEVLHVSPAAISGAVRYLIQVNLLTRHRERGSRRDLYVLRDEVWYEAIYEREEMLARWTASMRDGLDVLGRDTPAGERVAGTLAFYEFLRRELPALLDRWRAEREARPAP